MPPECNGLVLIDKTMDFCKINCKWSYNKRGRPVSKKKKTRPKVYWNRKVKNPLVISLTLEKELYEHIKKQSLVKSVEEGRCIEANELIREALNKTFPCPSLGIDMFGERSEISGDRLEKI